MTVFVAQRHLVVDRGRQTRQLVDKYDLSDAERFGPLVYCIEGDVDLNNIAPVVSRLDQVLATFTEKDFLLLIGSPLVIGLAFAVASQVSPDGQVNCLQWDSWKREYMPIYCNTCGEPE